MPTCLPADAGGSPSDTVIASLPTTAEQDRDGSGACSPSRVATEEADGVETEPAEPSFALTVNLEGYAWDELSGLWHHAESGYYYHPDYGTLFNADLGFTIDTKTGICEERATGRSRAAVVALLPACARVPLADAHDAPVPVRFGLRGCALSAPIPVFFHRQRRGAATVRWLSAHRLGCACRESLLLPSGRAQWRVVLRAALSIECPGPPPPPAHTHITRMRRLRKGWSLPSSSLRRCREPHETLKRLNRTVFAGLFVCFVSLFVWFEFFARRCSPWASPSSCAVPIRTRKSTTRLRPRRRNHKRTQRGVLQRSQCDATKRTATSTTARSARLRGCGSAGSAGARHRPARRNDWPRRREHAAAEAEGGAAVLVSRRWQPS